MPGMDDVFNDAKDIKASDEEIAAVGTLVKKALELDGEIEAMTASLKKLTDERREIAEKTLPEAMDAANCELFQDKESGKKVQIKDKVSASISKNNQPEAHEWMRKHGHEDLIKNQIVAPLDRGMDNVANDIVSEMKDKYGIIAERRESIHAQTLMAWCREQLEAGVEIPKDLLGVFIRRVAEIK